METYAVYIISKSGSLLYERTVDDPGSPLAPQTSNDQLVIAGNLHGIYAIASELTPRGAQLQPQAQPKAKVSRGSARGSAGEMRGTYSAYLRQLLPTTVTDAIRFAQPLENIHRFIDSIVKPLNRYTVMEDIEKQENILPQGLYNTDSLDHSVDTTHLISKVTTSNDGNYVYLGNKKFAKEDLVQAFGGSLNPGVTAPSVHKFANPAPLGLCGFALSTFVLSMGNAGAMGVKNSNVVVGLAAFYGGLIQLLAGMWEMSIENTFGATALSSFGGFWMSYAAINIPWFNIANSYTDKQEFANMVGFYLLGWSIFTFMLTLCTMKSTLAFFSLFFLLAITFLLLAISELAPSHNCKTAGGVLGVIVAFIAWYNAYAGLSTKENAYIRVKAVQLPVWKRE
ncbi:hypothetical protein CANINC_000657 [Pichia inconspicua]|uniref:Uncharacterized protein n=1 Tax=Pichia inconspicua TaxID=52247 RepID=A0A4T0X5J7_9ASCO|nr:hypothetical protein CANINC_000657 [[Candida] inconspicua]